MSDYITVNDGNFDDPNVWKNFDTGQTPAPPPTSTDIVSIGNSITEGTQSLSVAAALSVFGSLNITNSLGLTTTGSGDLQAAGGVVTVSGLTTINSGNTAVPNNVEDGGTLNANGGLKIGSDKSTTGYLNSTSTINTGGSDAVIGDAGTGTLELDNGGQLLAGGSNVTLGNQAGSSGTLRLQPFPGFGAGASADIGTLTLGKQGSGSLLVEFASTVEVHGQLTANNGGFDVNLGGTLNADGAIVLGDGAANNGSGTVSTGDLNVTGSLVIGNQGTGSLDIFGAGHVTTKSDISIGGDGEHGGSGSLTISGSGSKLTAADGAFVRIGDGGQANASVNDGGELDASGSIVSVRAASENTTLAVTGGKMEASRLVVGSDNDESFGKVAVDKGGNLSVSHDLVVGIENEGRVSVAGGSTATVDGSVFLGGVQSPASASGPEDTGFLGFFQNLFTVFLAGIRADDIALGNLQAAPSAKQLGAGHLFVGGSSDSGVSHFSWKDQLFVGGSKTDASTLFVFDHGVVAPESGGKGELDIVRTSVPSSTLPSIFTNPSVEVNGADSELFANQIKIETLGNDPALQVDHGGSVEVGGSSSAPANTIRVESGAKISGGGVLTAGASDTGAVGVASGSIVARGTLEAQGPAFLTIDGRLSGGGAVQIDAGSGANVFRDFGTNVHFVGSSAELELETPNQFNAAISGLMTGDTLVFFDTESLSQVSSIPGLSTLPIGTPLTADAVTIVDNNGDTFQVSGELAGNSFIESHDGVDVSIKLEHSIFGFHYANDGTLSGATVFVDTNGNGTLDAGETSTTTDQYGAFTLATGAGPLVAFGGTDQLTGLPFAAELEAPADSLVINPLTTLVAGMMADGVGEGSAEQQAEAAFALNTSAPLTVLDAQSEAYSGPTADAAAFVAGAKVLDTVEMISAALSGASGQAALDLSKTTFHELAAAIEALPSGHTVDLSDKATVTTLIDNVAASRGITLQAGAADAIASLIVASNSELDTEFQSDTDGVPLVTDVSAIERVTQGAAANALQAAAGDPTALAAVENAYSGTNLANAIAAARQQVSVQAGAFADVTSLAEIVSVTPSTSGEVDVGKTVQFALAMNTDVTVTGGAPQLELSNGAIATYDAGASTSTSLVFDYTAGANDYAVGLGITGLNLNGAAIKDAHGVNADLSNAVQSLPLDVNAAAVTAVTASPGTEAAAGQTVVLTMTMNKAVTITGGLPTLVLDDGGTATYDAAHSTTTKLVFDYVVQAGDQTPDLTVAQVNLNGGTILDASGKAADLGSAALFPTGLQVGAAYVTATSAAPSNSDLQAGDTLSVTIEMSQKVLVNTAGGSPTLALSDGSTAGYDANDSDPASGKLVFTHTVGAGDYATDLSITGVNLNGATINDANGVGADLSGALALQDFGLDENAAIVTAITPSQTGEIGAGATVTLTLTMSSGVTVNASGGTPSLLLNDGGVATFDAAATAALNDPTKLVFDYTAATGDQTSNLEVAQVSLNGATITDSHGNSADLSGAANQPTNLQVGPAVVTLVAAAPFVGNFATDSVVTFEVDTGQPLNINLSGGSPHLTLSDGATAAYDAYASDPSSGKLFFDYTVGAGDHAVDLAVTGLVTNGASIKDANGVAADFSGAELTTGIDVNAAVVTAVTPSMTGAVHPGNVISFALSMNEAVAVGGSPFLNLSNGGTAVFDNAKSTPTSLVFDYAVSPSDSPENGLGIVSVDANGATVMNGSGHTADLANALVDFSNIQIATLGVDSVVSTPAAGADLNAGKLVKITLNMGEAAIITGTAKPTLSLNDGGTATYLSGSGTSALVFQYTVAAGQNSSDLQVVGVNIPSGVTVKDATGNAADFSGAQNADLGLTIDTVAPTITGVAVHNPPANARVPLGATIEIDLTASEAVNVVGKPTLTLSDKGVATYDAGKSDLASGKIAFDYTPAAGQNTTDLQVTALKIGTGASIKDLAGNAIVVTGAAKKDLAVAVDTNVPTVSAVSFVLPQPGVTALKAGDVLTIKLTLSDATAGDTLKVTGTPALALSDGGSAFYDAADSSGNVLAFKYTVGSESTTDLKINGFDFTNGNITDAAGNPAAMAASDLKLTANVFTWAHGVSGDWNTGTNWTPNGVPGANNAALITVAGTYTVTSAQDNSVGLLNMATGATLAVTGNELDVTAGTGGGALAGKITVADGLALGFGATAKSTTFNNTGSVALNSTGDETDLIIAGNVTLLGAGKVTLSDNANNKIISNGDTATLTNGNATAGNTISGAGTIGDGELTLSNQAKGIINGNGVNNALTIDTAANAITNLGTLEGTTAKGLVIASNVTNSNLIEALGTNARVDLAGVTVTNNGTAATILASGTGAHVDLDDATIAGGALKATGTGAAIDVISAATFDGSGVGKPVNNTAIVNVQDGNSLTLKGTFNNTGTVALNSIGAETDLVISGSVAATGAGKIILNGTDAQIVSDGSTATLTNGNTTAGNTISGVGTIGDDFLSVTNAAKGIINASDPSGGILAIDAKSFTNSGLLEATGHGVLAINSDITDASTGLIKAAAAGAHVSLDDATITGGTLSTIAGSFLDSVGGSSTISTTTAIANAGRLGAEGGNLTITGPVKNTGTLDANNAHLTLQGAVTGTGKATIEGTGSIEFGAASATTGVTFANGAAGELILDHSMTFKGTIAGFTGPHNAFSNYFGFGDSTIDSGWFPTALANNLTADETGSAPKNALIAAAVAAGGTGTPVGLGLMNSQLLANDLGLTALPADTPGGKGTNFAIAGATDAPNLGSGSDPGNGGVGNLNKNSSLPSTVEQINNYLAANGNKADPNALYQISSGGNDISYAKDTISLTGTLAQEHAYLTNQATALATAIKALENAGAQHVLLDNNYGGGGLSTFYNNALATALASVGATVITANIQGVVATITANPTLFGFTSNTVQPGIVGPTNVSSAFITQTGASATTSGWGQWGANTTTPSATFAYLRAPNAQFTSLFSDNQHLSTIGQIIEANYEFAQLASAGLITSLDSIDLKDIVYNSPTSGVTPTIATFSGTATGGTLTVTDDLGHTAKLTLSGDYRSVSFITASDGSGGTLVFDPPASSDTVAAIADNPLSSGHYNGAITTGTYLGMTDFTVAKDVALSGDGTITLAINENIVSDGHNHTLTIGDDTIAGAGVIGDNALSVVVTADGVIDANSSDAGMLIQTPGHVLDNAGIIEATESGWLEIAQTTIANDPSGAVRALGADTRLDLDGATITGGNVTVGAGATVETTGDNASTIDAKLTNSGTVAATAGDLTIDGPVTNSGVMSAANGNHLAIDGAMTGSGSATIASGGTLEIGSASAANVTFLDGTGSLLLDHPTNETFKFASTVTGFQHGADIELAAIDYTTGVAQLTFVENVAHTEGVLAVTDGVHSDALILVGSYTADDFAVQQTVNHHVDILHV